MKPVRTFSVIPALPASLERLRELAFNLRWAWHHETISLFRRLNSDLWESTGHNPVLMLGTIDQSQLESAASDEAFLAHLERICRDLDGYLAGPTWFRKAHGEGVNPLVAYFSAEFGLTECLSIFAGGLGILAGDHVKSAGDLGLPMVCVGLLYQQGYFRQYLNEAGWQQEAYEDNDFHNLPLTLVRQADGSPLTVPIECGVKKVLAQAWRAQVGRVRLYLLDTNLPANPPTERIITDQLYGGDMEMRIQQEILLGIGGYRLLEKIGLAPTVYHLNEGHSAFLALERLQRLMETQSLSFAEARELGSAGLVFTTHTPVSAGHDFFTPALMEQYFAEYIAKSGLSRKEFLALGRQNPKDENEKFCMTILALRLAAHSNAVSRLHGQVTRNMWQGIWPGVPEEEVPIGQVTNGVHFRSWISFEMNQLYDRYLGPNWREQPVDRAIWQKAERIPSEELWHIHEVRRERLVTFARRRLREQLIRRGAPQTEIEVADEVLDPDALTIGFARRMATYKRATLLLQDPERLGRILNHPSCPVQVIFAGKAHPQDNGGKEFIRQILALSRQDKFRHRVVFLEDHDMAIARYLVQGADVWLNTPRRPEEASGTSGMKATANGVLNLSTLDGWWDEAWRSVGRDAEPIGWAIGRGETYDNHQQQDQVEAEALYDLLERDVVPAFYERGKDRLPRRWISRMKSSIGTLCHYFNTNRMVREYTEQYYLPAAARFDRLAADGAANARSLASWKKRVTQAWPQIRIESLQSDDGNKVQVRSTFRIRTVVNLGLLKPEEVSVELYLGRVDKQGEISEADRHPMACVGPAGVSRYFFEAMTPTSCRSGLHGYTVRILPNHPDLITPFLPGLIVWAEATLADG